MEDKYSLFISKYNHIETNINKLKEAPEDASMKWLEDNLIEDYKIRNKLYLCRIMRNYIQHNPDYKNFITINDGILEFLKEIELFVFSKLTTAKSVMIEGKKLVIGKKEDNLNDIIKIMLLKNYDYIPIFDQNTIKGILTKNEILNLYYQGLIKKTTKVSSLDEKKYLTINKDAVKFVKEDKLLEEILNMFITTRNTKKPLELILVTDTGNSKGKLLGLITEFDIFNYNFE